MTLAVAVREDVNCQSQERETSIERAARLRDCVAVTVTHSIETCLKG